MRMERGFTVVELLMVVTLLAIVVALIVVPTLFAGNYFYTEQGVLGDIQVDHPEAKRVLRSERNIYGYSEFLVENRDGSRETYYLDTNILFNYEVHDSPD